MQLLNCVCVFSIAKYIHTYCMNVYMCILVCVMLTVAFLSHPTCAY